MKKFNPRVLCLFVVIALLAISTSVVSAKELGLLTISGPGIKGEVTLKDPEAMMNLEKSGFFDTAALAKPPKDLAVAKGYDITAHLNLDGKMVPFIQMVYYPTNEGQSSYVHYTGRLDGETLRTVDEWYTLNRTADGALRDLMAANNITVQSALIPPPAAVEPAKEPVVAPAVEPVTAPAASPAPVQVPYIVVAVVVGILALAGVTLVLRRRTVSHPTA